MAKKSAIENNQRKQRLTKKFAARRKRLLDTNAFYWLSARARLKPVQVWLFLGLMAGWWLVE